MKESTTNQVREIQFAVAADYKMCQFHLDYLVCVQNTKIEHFERNRRTVCNDKKQFEL